MKRFAEKLIKLRGEKSREDVAKAIGVSISAISMYENGERVPRDSIKIKLAQYYGKTVQEIFFA
ncbi:MAG: helix-turn-helix transcriptional regulator [Lachnospiraceae bacterium]|nr:helix-turn-helix transcriptional regulator [Lachnospiraceae bacterium]MBQ9135471.1 helix-turn-helix transcriptional regulator [Lachnospiraceae bacterium]